MHKNNPLWRKDVSARDFEMAPIWAWDDAHDGYYAVSDPFPSASDYDDLLIKASFQTPDGRSFSGYLVGGGFYHAFFIFVDDQEFGFNMHLRELRSQMEKRLYEYLLVSPFPLFPLAYKSDVILKDMGPIEGVLDWENP